MPDNDSKYILDYDTFLRSVIQIKNDSNSFLLGAGASISSNIKSAADCIWDWKKEIFLSNNPTYRGNLMNIKQESTKKFIQEWLDNQKVYPKLGDHSEYSFYAEKAYPVEDDRRRYFESLSYNKSPYIGYRILCILWREGIIQSIWTTNFDGLVERAAQQMNIAPININLDNSENIFRSSNSKELLYIALHGDYKYSSLKNTDKELDTVNENFNKAINYYFIDKNLIVIGYSGRDKSLMESLKMAYSNKGGGRLYWCGCESSPSAEVQSLIKLANEHGRTAYYVQIDNFDKTVLEIAKGCLEDNTKILKEIKELKKSANFEEEDKTKFTVNEQCIDKITASNLHPVIFPDKLYEFKIKTKSKHLWNVIDNIIGSRRDIVAVPHKGSVFAISSKQIIEEVFQEVINSDINESEINVNIVKEIPVFQRLILKAILFEITQSKNIETDGKSKLWKKDFVVQTYKKRNIHIHDAIEIALNFTAHNNYALLSIKPTVFLETEDGLTLTEDIKVQLLKNKFDKLYNDKYFNLLENWNRLIFNGSHLTFYFPSKGTRNQGKNKQKNFQISPNTALAGIKVLSSQNISTSNFTDKRLIYKGIEIEEPLLYFHNKENIAGQYATDYHPMRGLVNNLPYDYNNPHLFSSSINLGVICPSNMNSQFYNFLTQINQKHVANENLDYLVDFPGFENIYKIPIIIPHPDSDKWKGIDFKQKGDLLEDAKQLEALIWRNIKDIRETFSDDLTIVILIPGEWEKYEHIEWDEGVFDLHDNIKAAAASIRISTQFIEQETLSSSLKCQIYWWLSLSFYVKSLRTPWVLSNTSSYTAYAGIGYSVKRKGTEHSIVIGCSHIYDSQGLGLKYRLAKIKDFHLDNKNNPFLTYDEAYYFGISILDLFQQGAEELPKRVVVHKRTDFTKEEIFGIVDSIKKAGVANVDLVTINFEKDKKFFSQRIQNNNLIPDNFPINRGTCIITNEYEALLWTHGIAPSVKGNNRKFYLGGRSIPSPLNVKKFYGSSDILTLAQEILSLTKINWNSLDLYTKLPATIDSSNKIAKLGYLLNNFEGKTYDYRFFI